MFYYHDCIRHGELQYFMLCDMEKRSEVFQSEASEWNAMITRKQGRKEERKKKPNCKVWRYVRMLGYSVIR